MIDDEGMLDVAVKMKVVFPKFGSKVVGCSKGEVVGENSQQYTTVWSGLTSAHRRLRNHPRIKAGI